MSKQTHKAITLEELTAAKPFLTMPEYFLQFNYDSQYAEDCIAKRTYNEIQQTPATQPHTMQTFKETIADWYDECKLLPSNDTLVRRTVILNQDKQLAYKVKATKLCLGELLDAISNGRIVP